MTTKSFFGISLKSPEERLFWFSRAGRVLFLGYFIYAVYTMMVSQHNLIHWVISHFQVQMGHPFPIDSFSTAGGLVLNTASSLLLCWWYWLVARLFKLCEKGMVFSPSTVSLMKKVGKLFLFFACVGLFNQILYNFILGPSFVPVIPGDEMGRFLTEGTYYIGFGMFGLQLNGINLEPIAVALMIFIAIGVIDEGRKVREEQELTV